MTWLKGKPTNPQAMEFPVLGEMHLPDSAVKIITQFLREPHPTALLFKDIRFYNHQAPGPFVFLTVRGYGIRVKDGRTPYPHTYDNEGIIDRIMFCYNKFTGEPFEDTF